MEYWEVSFGYIALDMPVGRYVIVEQVAGYCVCSLG